MPTLTRHDLLTLAAHRGPGLVSLYLPAPPNGSPVDQARIRLRKLLVEADVALVALGLRTAEVAERLAPARAFLDDDRNWPLRNGGVALFITNAGLETVRLPLPTEEAVHVADHLYLKPLVPLLSGDGRFHLLAISQHDVRLFEGSRETIRPLALDGVPRSLLDAVGHDVEQRSRSLRTVASGSGGRHQAALGHAHGAPRDDAKEELAAFLRLVDRGVCARIGHHGAPLVLAGVEYVTAQYRKTSAHMNLVEDTVAGSPDTLSAAQLHAAAWPLVADRFSEGTRTAAARFGDAIGSGLARDDLREILPAADAGRVALLVVALDAHRWGRVDPATLAVALREVPQPGDADLLDRAATAALRTEAEVHAVPLAAMPGGRSVAAVFRF